MTSDTSLLERDLQLLRVVQKHGPATLAIIGRSEARPLPLEPIADRIADLLQLRLVTKTRAGAGGHSVYSVTAKGAGAIAAADVTRATSQAAAALQGVGMTAGEAATAAAELVSYLVAPRRPTVKAGSYDGAELRPYTGRGAEALRAFALPSLVNGQRVERKGAPMLMASTRRDRIQDGRGR